MQTVPQTLSTGQQFRINYILLPFCLRNNFTQKQQHLDNNFIIEQMAPKLELLKICLGRYEHGLKHNFLKMLGLCLHVDSGNVTPAHLHHGHSRKFTLHMLQLLDNKNIYSKSIMLTSPYSVTTWRFYGYVTVIAIQRGSLFM